jgi:hypothetical protein
LRCGLVLAALTLATTTVAATDDDAPPQRVELPEIGLAASFPPDWRVRTPMSPRESWFDVSADDETPVFAWAGIFATGGDGRWCGIDRFEDFPWTIDEHAAFLERWHVSASLYGRSGGHEPIELPAGPAWRIEVRDELKERSSTLYLLEHADDHVLLTCADALGSEEDWLDIARSIELAPRSARATEVMAATLDAIHAD